MIFSARFAIPVAAKCPPHVTASASDGIASFRWDPLPEEAVGIRILRDGSEIARIGPRATAFDDVPAPGGLHLYSVAVDLGDAACPRVHRALLVPGPPMSPFRRGDVNADGTLDLSDAIFTLGYLFLGSPSSLSCGAAADANDDRSLDTSDAIYILGFLFLGGPPPAEPYEACGVDVTDSWVLSCAESAACGGPVVVVEPDVVRVIPDWPVPIDVRLELPTGESARLPAGALEIGIEPDMGSVSLVEGQKVAKVFAGGDLSAEGLLSIRAGPVTRAARFRLIDVEDEVKIDALIENVEGANAQYAAVRQELAAAVDGLEREHSAVCVDPPPPGYSELVIESHLYRISYAQIEGCLELGAAEEIRVPVGVAGGFVVISPEDALFRLESVCIDPPRVVKTIQQVDSVTFGVSGTVLQNQSAYLSRPTWGFRVFNPFGELSFAPTPTGDADFTRALASQGGRPPRFAYPSCREAEGCGGCSPPVAIPISPSFVPGGAEIALGEIIPKQSYVLAGDPNAGTVGVTEVGLTFAAVRFPTLDEAERHTLRILEELVRAQREAVRRKRSAIEELERLQPEQKVLTVPLERLVVEDIGETWEQVEKSGIVAALTDEEFVAWLSSVVGPAAEAVAEALGKVGEIVDFASKANDAVELFELILRADTLDPLEALEAFRKGFDFARGLCPSSDLAAPLLAVFELYSRALEAVGIALREIVRKRTETILFADSEELIRLVEGRPAEREKLLRALKVSRLLRAVQDP